MTESGVSVLITERTCPAAVTALEQSSLEVGGSEALRLSRHLHALRSVWLTHTTFMYMTHTPKYKLAKKQDVCVIKLLSQIYEYNKVND